MLTCEVTSTSGRDISTGYLTSMNQVKAGLSKLYSLVLPLYTVSQHTILTA